MTPTGRCDGCGEWVEIGKPDSTCIVANQCLERQKGPAMIPEEPKSPLTIHVCGGKQAKRCIDGGEHDWSAVVRFKDGGSAACAKCGVTAMEIDLLELP